MLIHAEVVQGMHTPDMFLLWGRPIMPMVKNVEKRIRDVEGFNIVILGNDGHDVKGNRQGLPQYAYMRAAKGTMTVEAWKSTRFRLCYPGFEVEVQDGQGQSIAGNTKLANLRKTYI